MMRLAVERVLSSSEIVLTEQQREQGKKRIARMDELLQSSITEKDSDDIQQCMIWLFFVQAGQIKVQGK
jgi:hypothetical protein